MKFFKVTTLPGSLESDAFYFVDNGAYAESYLTSSDGTAHAIGNTPMIQALANAAISAQLASLNLIVFAADIAARDAYEGAATAMLVLVQDASADPTVDAGAALYFWDPAGEDWIKVAEYESMDVSVAWSAITGRPSSSPATIDDAVSKRHTHTNLATLNKVGESSGRMTFDGETVGATWEQTSW